MTVAGRWFSMIWIVTGLCILGVFSSILTTALSGFVISNEFKVYGSKVSAVVFFLFYP